MAALETWQSDLWSFMQAQTAPGNPGGVITLVSESGIPYKVNLESGQKTGFYVDQRDSRALIARLSTSKRVLDLYCYTGGFALAAAAGGAQHVAGECTGPASQTQSAAT